VAIGLGILETVLDEEESPPDVLDSSPKIDKVERSEADEAE